MSNRVSHFITLILEDSRLSRLQHNIEMGNHPFTNKETESKIKEFILKETSKGYLLPIPKQKVMDIPGVEACLIYIVQQGTIDKNGNKVIKYRPCYDLSYNPRHKDRFSINNRYIVKEIHTIQYVFTF